MKHTAKQTACLLAVILNRSGQTRARVSSATIKILAIRETLRSAFAFVVIDEIDDYGWVLFEISGGGFGAIQAKALQAAKPVTAKRWLTDDERKALRRGALDWAALETEASPEIEQPGDDDD